MNAKVVNISLPTELVAVIDAEAALRFESRSEYIKRALVMRLETAHIPVHPNQPKTEDQARHDSLRNYLYKTRKDWNRTAYH